MTRRWKAFCRRSPPALLIGAVYGLMCVGLGLIFGVMRVINFAHGDFMMLGMYAAFYFFTALGVQATFGNTFGPFVAILLAGPVLAVFGYFVHLALISRVSGTRTSSARGRRSLCPAHPDARHRADPAEWRPDRVRLGAGLDPHAAVELGLGARAAVQRRQRLRQQGARHRRRGLAGRRCCCWRC